MLQHASAKSVSRILLSVITWFALVLQFTLMLKQGTQLAPSRLMLITNFFSYFTILSNILVAACLTFPWLMTSSAIARFFSRILVQAAVAVYIFIVGLVYNLVLRNIWNPTGWQLVADNLLHVVVPVGYVVYWFLFTPHRQLEWKNIFPWLLFPGLYLVYSLMRGAVTGWYPYPFLNADQFGYSKVAFNAAMVLIAFIVTGLGVIAIDRNAGSGRKS